MLRLSIHLRQTAPPAVYPQPTLQRLIARPVDYNLGFRSQVRHVTCTVAGRQVMIPTTVDRALVRVFHLDNQSATYPAQFLRVPVAQAAGNLMLVARHPWATTPTVLRNPNLDALVHRSEVPMLALTVTAIQQAPVD